MQDEREDTPQEGQGSSAHPRPCPEAPVRLLWPPCFAAVAAVPLDTMT